MVNRSTSQEISYNEFLEWLDQGKVERVKLETSKLTITRKDDPSISGMDLTFYTGRTDDPDLGPIEEGEIDVLEDYFVVVRQDLAHTVHREDDLFVGHGCQFRLSVAAADSI